MEYIVGKTAGFCYGVKNAVEKSEKALENEKPIYCLGEIVHNKNVVKDLENKGIIFIDDLKQNLEKRKTIIRAHGIAKEVYTQADKMGIDLIDLTCPKVLKIHKIVSEYNEKEYYIFLVGSKKHPEIIGTASFCGDDVSIIENIDDINISIDNFKKSNRKKLAIVVQTTFSLQKFTEITESIKKKFKNFENIEVVNTICNATKIRQEETEELSKKVDCMIIVGGKNSSNTKKLYEISKKNCNNTICVEEVNEIDKGVLKQGNIVGIMAGASTPQCSINSVIELVKNT
jgi:(E)-4-hydroxy-3-methyl-but-2-enyl pyrophosphate reductase